MTDAMLWQRRLRLSQPSRSPDLRRETTFILHARNAAPRAPTTAQVRIAAIDFAHWQSRHPVLIQADRSITGTRNPERHLK